MKSKIKRFLSLILAVAMLLTTPVVSFAEESQDDYAFPTAKVTEISTENLTFAMNFLVDEITDEQLAYYEDWYADFELTVNKTVTFNNDGTADGYLSGQYDEWSPDWVNVPAKAVTINAGETIRVMEFGAELLGKPGLRYTFGEVYTGVKDFDCGIYFTEEFLEANPDVEVTLELRMYETAESTEGVTVGDTYVYTIDDIIPNLPTATVTKIQNPDLTFAMNFKVNEATDDQLAYYDKWYADFELTVNKDVTFNNDGSADGYLSGQYDNWSENWVNVPIGENVSLKANETVKIMEFAAKLMGEPGLKYTFGEVYTGVLDFDCGIYFTPEFIEANPDLKVTLELRMYNPDKPTESYTLGNTYVYTVANIMPELPSATVTEIEKEDLTFAMNFTAVEPEPEQKEFFRNWYADFELTINKDVTFNSEGTADGYLSGQYDFISPDWINVPPSDVTLKANEPLKIMAYAAELMGEPDLKLIYNDILTFVKDFDCGIYFTPEFLEANPDLKVTLELKMYNPIDETEGYVLGESYVFTNEAVAMNVQTGDVYMDVTEALFEATAGQWVVLLKDVTTSMVTVPEDITLNLDGYTLNTKYFSCFGNTVDKSEDKAGLLIVPEKRILMQESNAQLPVKNGEGYKFVDIIKFNTAMMSDYKFVFQPLFKANAHPLMLLGTAVTGATINVRVSWTQGDGVRSQDFVYNDDFVTGFINSYRPASGKYGKMFTLALTGAENFENLTFTAVVISDTGVEIAATPIVIEIEEGNVTTDSNNKVTEAVTLQNGQSSAVVSSGTQLEANTKDIALTIEEMDSTTSNIQVGDGESMLSMNVHVEGVSDENTVPVIVTLDKIAPEALNEGNILLYHVEDGETVAMTRVYSLAEVDAHNEFYYDVSTGTVTMALATFSEIAVRSVNANPWNGVIDTDWYNTEDTYFEFYTADQLAGLGQIVGGMAAGIERDSFEGKTVKLLADINLDDAEDDNKIFHPIGYYFTLDNQETPDVANDVYSAVYAFKGTFDGNGHKIANFYQNTWEMKGDYNDGYPAGSNHYKDGMGLFGYVKNGTVMNLTIDNFSSDGEFTPTGVVAAYGVNSTFKNIAITNCNPRVYNTGNGGIVGIGGNNDDPDTYNLVFENITIDKTNKITALWGSWDVACGGLVGMFRGAGHAYMTNCHVAAQIDVFNDVCGNYQYYRYRYAGMLIGTNKNMVTINGSVYPETTKYHAEDCTVHFGDWNDYYYCEMVVNSLASYTHDHQFSRLTQVDAVDVANMTVTVDGVTSAIPTSGRVNYVIANVNYPGDETAQCFHFVNGEVWNHEDAGTEVINGKEILKEDRQHYFLPFTQLFTGYGWGVNHIVLGEFDGVTVLEREVADSVDKFEVAGTAKSEYETGSTILAGDLFAAINGVEVPVDMDNVQITVSPVDENSNASGTYVANETDWTQGSITFSGLGQVQVIITDYFYCNSTTMIIDVTTVTKFKVSDSAKSSYTEGAEIKVGDLFAAVPGAPVDINSEDVVVEIDSNLAVWTGNADWTQGSIHFRNEGTVIITITDNDRCVTTSVTINIVQGGTGGPGVGTPDIDW
ncbi:MAG: hypothetical protein E7388_03190 [Ruminococcaceae bacterium]|nr:hypothetical protein [Oscillospiraceae bacterium]